MPPEDHLCATALEETLYLASNEIPHCCAVGLEDHRLETAAKALLDKSEQPSNVDVLPLSTGLAARKPLTKLVVLVLTASIV